VQRLNWRLFGPRLVDGIDGVPVWFMEHRFGACGRVIGASVTAGHQDSDGPRGRVGAKAGIETCGSRTGCLRCARKIGHETAGNLRTVLTAHEEAGGGILFVTLTASHTADEALVDVLTDFRAGWRAFSTSNVWKRFKRWVKVGHWFRMMEITRSDAHGWHVHYHLALLTERPTCYDLEWYPEERNELEDKLTDLWAEVMGNRGRDVHDGIGVDLQPVRGVDALAGYLSKVELEAVRSDLKKGRNGSRTPWEIATDAANGDPRSTALWVEYVETMKGVRHVVVQGERHGR